MVCRNYVTEVQEPKRGQLCYKCHCQVKTVHKMLDILLLYEFDTITKIPVKFECRFKKIMRYEYCEYICKVVIYKQRNSGIIYI